VDSRSTARGAPLPPLPNDEVVTRPTRPGNAHGAPPLPGRKTRRRPVCRREGRGGHRGPRELGLRQRVEAGPAAAVGAGEGQDVERLRPRHGVLRPARARPPRVHRAQARPRHPQRPHLQPGLGLQAAPPRAPRPPGTPPPRRDVPRDADGAPDGRLPQRRADAPAPGAHHQGQRAAVAPPPGPARPERDALLRPPDQALPPPRAHRLHAHGRLGLPQLLGHPPPPEGPVLCRHGQGPLQLHAVEPPAARGRRHRRHGRLPHPRPRGPRHQRHGHPHRQARPLRQRRRVPPRARPPLRRGRRHRQRRAPRAPRVHRPPPAPPQGEPPTAPRPPAPPAAPPGPPPPAGPRRPTPAPCRPGRRRDASTWR